MASNQALSLRIEVDASGAVQGLKVATKGVDGAAQEMRTSLRAIGEGAKESSHHAEGLSEKLREFGAHAAREHRAAGQFARQLQGLGLDAKGAGGEIGALVGAFAVGGGIGLGIEIVKILGHAFMEAGEEIKKANEAAEKSINGVRAQVQELILSLQGLTAAEKLRHDTIAPLEEKQRMARAEWVRALAQQYEAEEKIKELQEGKQAIGAQEVAALRVAEGRVKAARDLLDITLKQIKESGEAIDPADEEEVAQAAYAEMTALAEKNAHDGVEIDAARIAEMKKHNDEVTAATLKFFKDEQTLFVAQDKAEGASAKALFDYKGHLIEEAYKLQVEIEKKQTDSFKKNAEVAAQAGAQIGSIFADMASGQKTLLDLTRQVMKDVVHAVVQAAMKQLAAYALTAEGAAALSVAGTPFIGAFLAVGAIAAMGALFDGLLSQMPSAAVGGSIPMSVSAMPVIAHGGEDILPRQQTAGLADFLASWRSGGVGGQPIYIQAWDGQDVERVVRGPVFRRALREGRRNGEID